MASEASVAANNDIREQAAQHTLAANPLVGVRGQDILDSARLLLGQVLSNPVAAAQQYLTWLTELGRIATGTSELAPDAKDRRFADPAWRERPGAARFIAFWMKPSSTSAMPSARGSSSRSSWTRCRRPIRSQAIPRH